MRFTPSKGLENSNEDAGGFVKGTGEFLSQMSRFRLTPLDTEWINTILNNTRREDIPNAYKKILNDLSAREKDIKQGKVVDDVLVTKKIYMEKYKQWKNGELPGKALISEVKSGIEYMENAAKIFEGEQIDKSGFQFPYMSETSQGAVGNAINYLRAFYDELETANRDKQTVFQQTPDSLPPQAPETDEKMTAYLKGKGNTKESIKNSNGEHEPWKKHYLAQSWKENNITLYHVMERAYDAKIFRYDDDGFFNFNCDKGCVGLIFSEAGYTDYKSIFPHIKINGEPPATSTLGNAIKNSPPNSWEGIRKILFT